VKQKFVSKEECQDFYNTAKIRRKQKKVDDVKEIKRKRKERLKRMKEDTNQKYKEST